MHRSHSLVDCQLVTIPPNSELLKGPHTGLVSFFFSLYLDCSSSSGLSVLCCPSALPSVSPLLPTATPAVGPGVEGTGPVTRESSSGCSAIHRPRATQRNRFLCKSPCSSPPSPAAPPPCCPLDPCFFCYPRNRLQRHPGLTSWRHLFTNSAS